MCSCEFYEISKNTFTVNKQTERNKRIKCYYIYIHINVLVFNVNGPSCKQSVGYFNILLNMISIFYKSESFQQKVPVTNEW